MLPFQEPALARKALDQDVWLVTGLLTTGRRRMAAP
jgi:hypothetical protein